MLWDVPLASAALLSERLTPLWCHGVFASGATRCIAFGVRRDLAIALLEHMENGGVGALRPVTFALLPFGSGAGLLSSQYAHLGCTPSIRLRG